MRIKELREGLTMEEIGNMTRGMVEKMKVNKGALI